MGIKNLGKFLRENTKNAVTKIQVKDLEGKTIAIDTSLIMHQFLIAIKTDSIDWQTKEGVATSHIYGIIMKALTYVRRNIKPIFVFDGIAPIMKKEVLDKRKEIKEKAHAKLKVGIEAEKIKLLKKTVEFGYKKATECIEILKLMGIPVIQAPGEADAQCAELVKENKVDYVVSEDMDLLTFGTPKLLRGSIAKDDLVVYDLEKILDELKLTYLQFIDLCILSGCDYLPQTILKVGIGRAYKLIKEHGSIENILKNDKNILNGNYKVPENFDYKTARAYFLNPPIAKLKKKDLLASIPNDKLLKEKLKGLDFKDDTIMNLMDVLFKGRKKLFVED